MAIAKIWSFEILTELEVNVWVYSGCSMRFDGTQIQTQPDRHKTTISIAGTVVGLKRHKRIKLWLIRRWLIVRENALTVCTIKKNSCYRFMTSKKKEKQTFYKNANVLQILVHVFYFLPGSFGRMRYIIAIGCLAPLPLRIRAVRSSGGCVPQPFVVWNVLKIYFF